MSDIIDAANDHAMNLTEDSLKAVRDLVPQEKHELTEEDLECVQCCGEINPARAAKGYDTCIDCARDNERYDKQYNRKPSRYYDDEE